MTEQRPPWLNVEKTGKRLGLSRSATLSALRAGIIPHVRFGNQYKVPVDAPGRILARAYEVWPLEDRPSYTIEELESLRAISIDELAPQIGLKRSATYDAVKAGRIPAIKIGKRYAFLRMSYSGYPIGHIVILEGRRKLHCHLPARGRTAPHPKKDLLVNHPMRCSH